MLAFAKLVVPVQKISEVACENFVNGHWRFLT